jgi:hypothetical protein
MGPVIYILLAVVVMIYAAVLDRLHKRYEEITPDYTWIEVVIGTVLCLAAAALYVRTIPAPTWHDYERAVWLAFGVGGIVIITWQVALAIARHQEVRRKLGAKVTASLAGQCGSDQAANNRVVAGGAQTPAGGAHKDTE